MDLGITGKTALVAAASKGFGRAVAHGLAAEACRVAICGRTSETLEQAAAVIREQTGGDVLPVVADVSQEPDCRRFVDTAAERLGGVDILVTNTGGPDAGDFDSIDEENWRDGVDSTLMNVVRLTRLVVPHMRRRRWGRIVNIASISAKQPIDGLLLSNALRPAIVGYAKTLALELAKDHILVNTVCPGMHLTDRLRHLAEIRAEQAGVTVDQQLERMASNIPLGRIGHAEELADVVLFLCSERASFVTGQAIAVDGGAYRGLA